MGKVITEMGVITWISLHQKRYALFREMLSASRLRLDWSVLAECGDNADWIKHCMMFGKVELASWDIPGPEQIQDELLVYAERM